MLIESHPGSFYDAWQSAVRWSDNCASSSPVPSPQSASCPHCQWHKSEMTNRHEKHSVKRQKVTRGTHNHFPNEHEAKVSGVKTLSCGHPPTGLCSPGTFSRRAGSSSVLRCPRRWVSCHERRRSLCWSPEGKHTVQMCLSIGAFLCLYVWTKQITVWILYTVTLLRVSTKAKCVHGVDKEMLSVLIHRLFS